MSRADAGGVLVLVATPIGNLGDLAPRAVDELARAGTIVCEDTRRTGRLLAHAGVRDARLLAVHEHNEASQVPVVLARLAAGERVAVVTDAGTPGVSDPGERLVRAAIDAGHRVEVVPGPSAAIAALVVSGLPTGRFCVEGFLPRTGPERTARLSALAGEERTTVLFEAPHRLDRTLADLATACGADRRVVIARELTKLYEDVWRGTLGDALAVEADHGPRGEHVIVLEGAAPAAPPTDDDVEAAVQTELAAGASARDAAAAVAAALGVPRRRAYAVATRLRRRD